MEYLIDTHTLLWIITDDSKLSLNARNIYLDTKNDIKISIGSMWEIAIKLSLGKLTIEESFDEFIYNHVEKNNIGILTINMPHVLRVAKLPYHHRDPFDRMIIAQCIENNLPIISTDTTFDQYPVKRIW